MQKVTNIQVFGLDESIYRSGYPMLKNKPDEKEFQKNVESIREARINNLENGHIKRAVKLAQAKGGGHDQFLTGITVTFDLDISNKCWIEAERYTFLNFISSMSTMHRLSYLKIRECCNRYVDEQIIKRAEELQNEYNSLDHNADAGAKKEAYLKLLYNIPSGFELTAGMITNYRCLKNIYSQRKTHALPDWHVVCGWIEGLPLANELIMGVKRTNVYEDNQ